MMQSSAKLRESPANPLPADWKEWTPKAKEKYLSRLRSTPAIIRPGIAGLEEHGTESFAGALLKCPLVPTRRQADFLALTDDEALYGGAAGGGKSEALLYWLAEGVLIPNYTGIIFRRTYPQLAKSNDGIIAKSFRLYRPMGGTWNGTEKQWRFPSGAIIELGHLPYEMSVYDYQGPSYHRIAFDEVTQFSLGQYLYLKGRLRSAPNFPIPIGIRASANPGGEGHVWVKGRFITNEALGAIAHLRARDPSPTGLVFRHTVDTTEGPITIAFCPARLADNPYIDFASYAKSLAAHNPIMRERMLNGDWSVNEASLIRANWLRYYTTKGDFLEAREPLENKCVGSIDRRACQRFATVDTAGTSKQKAEERKGKPASWSVAAIWEYWPAADFLFLRHVWRDRVDFTDLCGNVERLAREWGGVWHIENAHLGPALEAVLRRKGINVRSLPTVTKAMTGDSGRPGKVERSTPLQNRLEAGKLFLPAHETTWRPVLEGEWLGWTGLEEETADQIDVASYACDLVESDTGTIVFPKW